MPIRQNIQNMGKNKEMPINLPEGKPGEENGSAVEGSEGLPKVSGVTIDFEKGVITLKMAGDAVLPDKGDDG